MKKLSIAGKLGLWIKREERDAREGVIRVIGRKCYTPACTQPGR